MPLISLSTFLVPLQHTAIPLNATYIVMAVIVW